MTLKKANPTLFITSGSEVSGFAAIEMIMKNYKSHFDRVICGVAPDRTDFRDRIRRLGAEVKEVDPRSMDEEKLAKMLSDIDCVYLVPPFQHDVDTLESTKTYINAIKKAEVKNVVALTSIQPYHCSHEDDLVDEDALRPVATSSFPSSTASSSSASLEPSKHHYRQLHIFKKIEKYLKENVENFCILRRTIYQELIYFYADKIKNESMIPWPLGYGAFAPISHDDVAMAAATVLTHLSEKERGWIWSQRNFTLHPEHHKKTFTLTGPEKFTGYTMSMIASHALSQSATLFPDKLVWVGFQEVSRDDAQEFLNNTNELSSNDIAWILDVFDIAKQGRLDYMTWDFQKIVKGPSKPFHKLMVEAADMFR